MVKTIDEIIDEVIEKNIYSNKGNGARLSIDEVKEVINKLPIMIYGDNTTVDITPNGIVVKPTVTVS